MHAVRDAPTTLRGSTCASFHQPGPVQVVLDEPATVHYIGVLQSRDHGPPSSSAVYSWLGLNGLQPDFNGTINATQAGVPFSSGQAQLYGMSGCLQLVWGRAAQLHHCCSRSWACGPAMVTPGASPAATAGQMRSGPQCQIVHARSC